MKTLFLSIGHNLGQNYIFGPKDQGATGNGTTEFVEAKKVVDAIVARGIPGIIVKKVPEGLNLKQRIAYINKACVDGDVCIEFHLDSATPTARGAGVWYMTGSQFAQDEGKQFLAEYTNITGLSSRHVRPDCENRLGALGFVRDTRPLALLVELGFISNVNDLQAIRTKGIAGVISGLRKML